MTDHKQANITHPKTGEIILVDSRLKKLILALWDAQIRTYCSCQDHDGSGFGYIKIADSRDKLGKAYRGSAERLIQELGWLLPIWADFSPKDVFLRFKTRDIAKLTGIMTEGV